MKLLIHTFYLYTGFFVYVIGGFALLKLLSLKLSPELLGKYFFFSGLGIIIGTLAQAGFPYIFQRYLPVYRIEGKERHRNTLILMAILFHFLSLVLIGPFIGLFIKDTAGMLIFAGFYLHTQLDMLFYALISEMRTREPTFFKALYYILIIPVLILLKKFSLMHIGITLISVNGLTLLLTYLRVFTKRLELVGKAEFYEMLRLIKKFSFFSFLTHLTAPVFTYIDRLLIPLLLDYTALGIFQIARRIEQGARSFLFIPLNIFAPEVSRLYELGEEGRAKRLLKLTSAIYLLWGLFLGLLMYMFPEFLIRAISRSSYAASSHHLRILSGGFFISLLYAPYLTYIRSRGNIKPVFIVNLVWLGVFTLFAFIFTPFLGLSAFSWGMNVSYAVIGILTVLILTKSR